MAPPSPPHRKGEPPKPDRRRLAFLSLAALGVVYGDIGTSPLYALRECFHGEYGVATESANVLGVLSLMFWALVIVVSGKYVTFILRADNRGEGGVIAMTALVLTTPALHKRSRWLFAAIGLFAASMLYGDGMITPAISVLSAVEGIRHITPGLDPLVIPVTVGILAALFLVQRKGTAAIGSLFGPVTLLWLLVLGVLGAVGIAREPHVLLAVNPAHAVRFMVTHRLVGFLELGAVFLVVTGAEALYADLGHFGPRPIRLAWFAVAMPALLLNYFGQGAQLLSRPELAADPFYALAPSWAIIPLVVLATAATIIASQAVISGAFSLTRQAVQLDYLPRLRIVHTSARKLGQIYVPPINWLLMIATIVLVLAFRSSSGLAAAYGVAVTGTMTVSTILFYVVARKRWKWSRLAAGIPAAIFLATDLSFFGANISKVNNGAWFPLAVGAGAYILMSTWRHGRTVIGKRLGHHSTSIEELMRRLDTAPVPRVPGRAVFLSGTPKGVPPALLHNLEHNNVLHEEVVLLTVVTTEATPHLPDEERVEVEHLGRGISRVVARYGFQETPSVPRVLALARDKGLDVPVEDTSFFIGRAKLMPRSAGGMLRWRQRIFAYLARNALDPTAFYGIPADQVVELGSQVEL